MATCETCRWFKPHETVEVPPEPAETTRFLFFTVCRDPLTVRIERYKRQNLIISNESGYCRRYPEPIEKRRTSLCGEHQPKEASNAE